tara:strand:- start:1518 stop:2216 length:699 start_codon:yes stop_codon:yes gene_type:complete
MTDTPLQGGSAQHRAFQSIRADLLAGCYEPGEKLRIEDICTRYQTGISPVREALSRLAETGLIVALPQRGYRVASVSTEEYADLVEMRLRLEPDALYRSIKRGDIEWEARVAAAHQRVSSAQKSLKLGSPDALRDWAREDRGFHAALISDCGSPWLLHFCRTLHEQVARYHRVRILEGIAPSVRTEDEHEELVRAALGGKADIAANLLNIHIRNVADRIGTALARTENGQPH